MNTFGEKIRVTVFGQSHAPAIGVTVDGLPCGVSIDQDELYKFMLRRAPGTSNTSTARKEADRPVIVSGLNDKGLTCGAPLTVLIYNSDAHSKDYSGLFMRPRPSHADFPAWIRYGENYDIRGGGQFSGRLTAPLCIAGGILMQILKAKGIHIGAHILSVNDVRERSFDMANISANELENIKSKDFPTIDDAAAESMKEKILFAKQNLDSAGGVVECAVVGLEPGLGEPEFCGIENAVSQAVFAIPAVKGIEFGLGFESTLLYGSENNDEYAFDGQKTVTLTNNAGGICCGMTTGMPVVFRAAFKPTPSIAKAQNSVDLASHENIKLEIKGRHDPCVVVRAVPCVEAAAAIAISQFVL